MTLQVEVDLASGVPPYEQVRLQVMAHVSAGRLRAGDRLPTIRALATDLGVAAGTVARAYRELEAAGVVTTRRRTGTVVAAGAVGADHGLHRAAATFVATARAAGLGDDDVLGLVRGALLEHPSAGQGRLARPSTGIESTAPGEGGEPGPAERGDDGGADADGRTYSRQPTSTGSASSSMP